VEVPDSKRRDQRFLVQIGLTLRQGMRTQEVRTDNVSYRGLFVRTDRPPPLRQLVKLEAVLAPGGVRFVTHGMSVFVIAPGDPAGRTPGAGIQFYGMGDERRSWERFVNHVKPLAEGSGVLPVLAGPPPSGPEPVRRLYERSPLVLEVRPRSIELLLRMWSRDVSAGGLFLATRQPFAVGAELALAIKHPKSGASFALDVVVRRVTSDPPGIGVEIVAMNDLRRRDFNRFVTGSVPSLTPGELGLLDID
jgi:Tfp pilus assembly protein PilZ